VIQNEFDRSPEELFATIEHEPFAAASTAQVHRATLHDGTLVAVKVQRPRIVAKTKADLGVITELATIAERRLRLARKVSVRSLVLEFAGGVLKELDYRNEAYHAKRMADNLARFEDIAIPHIYDELSGTRVLTMEFVRGIKISNTEALHEAGFDTDDLGNTFIRSVIKQVLIDGFFHGDPHPGNLLADPEKRNLVYLDLGLVGQLSGPQRVDLGQRRAAPARRPRGRPSCWETARGTRRGREPRRRPAPACDRRNTGTASTRRIPVPGTASASPGPAA